MGDRLMTGFHKEMEEIRKRFENTFKDCKEQAEELRNFTSDLTVLVGFVIDNSDSEEAKQSVLYLRFLQSIFDLNELPCLLMAAQYTSGIQLIRYRLESMIQAYYLDQQHPVFSLQNKVAILTEISDKREYFVSPLIKKLSVGHKDIIRELYKELSAALHPSHSDFPTIEQMLERLKGLESIIDCDKMKGAIELTKRTYDAIFFLVLGSIPGGRKILKDETGIKEVIERHNLALLRKYI